MAHDPVHDFDFFFGSWAVRHRQLKARLANCTAWIEFHGTCTAQPILGGAGNMDDNIIHKPDTSYRAATLRTFDPASKSWAIWWFDGRMPHNPVDPPMKGSFTDGVGTFLADETFEGKPIKVRFIWSRISPTFCQWEQAFSEDGGKSWETNWIMENTRMA
ncbi:MAG: DUF1579 domain-containing protein [Alphaproteobacteria bacterium]|nr:DUF1579 domain-containing protein [Alphaproteobacteria bacterium]MBV9541184.1 DUF1579 domain-containing protein [Alphaproteobacteria bacterium]MBV9903218.1 DUF1579 domain-containing protein [Alphaproteobacteria bacterium]